MYTFKIYINGNDDLKKKYIEAAKKHNEMVLDPYPNAGFDLFTPTNIYYVGNSTLILDTQVVGAMFTNDQVPIAYLMFPRSSIIRTNLRLANSIGLIDSGYRGNLIASFDTKGQDEQYTIQEYTRLLQVTAFNGFPFYVKIMDHLEELGITLRGVGGFGSTGI